MLNKIWTLIFKIRNEFLLRNSFSHILVLILILSACIQAPSSKRSIVSANSTNNNNNSNTSNIPTFKDGYNFFQNGGTIYTSSFSLSIDFTDSFYFRGKDVDAYIRNTNSNTPICLIARYPQTGVKKITVMAMLPKSTYNYSNQSLEYYYSISPGDDTLNQTNCLKTSLVNKLTYGSDSTLIYKLKSLCNSGICSSNGYTSEQIQLYTINGVELTSMATTGLLFSIKNSTATTTPTNSTCVSNSECKSQGYDCCLSNQCVTDLSAKTLTSDMLAQTEYKQALQDILNNPAKIYNYPQYYNICSTSGSSSSTTTTTNPNDLNNAQVRLNTLASYYNCVNKVIGESGQCTKTYSNITSAQTIQLPSDDRSFATTFTNDNYSSQAMSAIEKIYYGNVLLFDYTSTYYNDTRLSNAIITDSAGKYFQIIGNNNDELTSGAKINLLSGVFEKSFGATSTDLVVIYKNDASCTYINATTSKCEKYYTQKQSSSGTTKGYRVTDHFPASNTFILPSYANENKLLKVELDGITLIEGTDWDLVKGSPNYIKLYPGGSNSLKAQDNQVVKITFFSTLAPMTSKLSALEGIKNICKCSDYSCNLSPVKNTTGTIVDYACVYPSTSNTTIPLSQKIYLSSKSVPMRFYDSSGQPVDSLAANSVQEGSNDGIEVFKYTNNDLSKPNNLNSYVGFYEIYGSLSNATNSAKPPQVVNVKKGNLYDIYVDNGSFYTCAQCGSDYYSQLNKLFPSMSGGGGTTPMQTQSSRIATNSSMIRSDEFAFGRACFVPATMLPWSQALFSDVLVQRKNRLQTQHFLFANGYQRDWYGFDYGAVIGSFDGVKWFAIGKNRRIKAASNKMFIAVNAYMGDLTVESTYTVSINDGTLNPSGTGMVQTDLENSGAECQNYHMCNYDKDCYATLGPDYTCSAISEITTSWPVFDDNANEVAEMAISNNQLANILGVSNTNKKRCVYRGKGALCTPNYNAVNTNSTFNATATYDFHACSPNNYCQTFSDSSGFVTKFNNRVNRYGKVVADSTADTFGLAAPVAMRPLNFNGQEIIGTAAVHNLSSNKAIAMCIPGKNPEATTFLSMNSSTPDTTNYLGDRVVGIGHTLLKLSAADNNYLNACGVFNSSGNYYFKDSDPTTTNSTNTNLIGDAGGQNIPANSLYYFNSLFNLKGISFNSLTANSSSRLTSLSIVKNSCMKAAGASCYSDLDCAPSKTIADKIKLINYQDSSFNAYLNPYEIRYWQENLVCSQATPTTDSTFDPKNNKCCREVGSIISMGQNSIQIASDVVPKPNTSKAPGIDLALNSMYRYSRVATYYSEMKSDSTSYPALSIPITNECSLGTSCFDYSKLANQSKTFALVGSKTSCSNSWIRSFANGTHTWSVNKFQSFNANAFKCYNFTQGSGSYSCSGAEDENDTACKFVQTSPTNAKAKAVFKFMGKMELMGIPQIAVPTATEFMTSTDGDLSCRSNPNDQSVAYPDASGEYLPPTIWWANPTGTVGCSKVGITKASTALASQCCTGYINPTTMKCDNIPEMVDTSITPNRYYHSVADTSNFNSSFKQVFKSDEIVSCLPTGTKMTAASEAAKCCSGYISAALKCALPDYVDLSIYTNRFVSSEGSSLSATFFDEDGYIKDPTYVAQLACKNSMCESGKISYGLAISNVNIPGLETGSANKYYRFLQNSSTADAPFLNYYNLGLKINSHAYCIPKNLSTNTDMTIISCQ